VKLSKKIFLILKKIGYEVAEWIELAQIRGLWRVVEEMIINLRVSKNLAISTTRR